MSYSETIDFGEGLRLVEKELQEGEEAPGTRNEELPLQNVKMWHTVFQPREFESTGPSEDHVRALVDAIKAEPGNRLDPITVWWSGKHWPVLNGHHRIMAYARARKNGFKQHQPSGKKTAHWIFSQLTGHPYRLSIKALTKPHTPESITRHLRKSSALIALTHGSAQTCINCPAPKEEQRPN